MGWAIDWQLQWHLLRQALPRYQLVFTDALGVEVMHQAGIAQARSLNLFGLQGAFAEPLPETPPERDIDLLFVGNLSPAVQGERLPWLGRLARLASRYRVAVVQGVGGEAYRRLLLRSKIAFNRSLKGEWNLRVGEACSCGALLLQEAGNREMQSEWRHGVDCVFYGEDDLEALVEHYLTHEEQRRAVAEDGGTKALTFTFAHHWGQALAIIEREREAIRHRLQQRPALAGADRLWLRSWQAMGAADQGDTSLAEDLDRASSQGELLASLACARAVQMAMQGRDREGRYPTDVLEAVARLLHQAVRAEPGHALAALNLVEALSALGQRDLAAQGARRLLGQLATGPLSTDALDTPRFPPGYDVFRVGWEEAAWKNAGFGAREAEAKRGLLRWRLHELLAELTGELAHHHEAALARPDTAHTRAALGCALARAGRLAEAVPHLQFALVRNLFDSRAARALYQALSDHGAKEEANELAEGRRWLSRAAGRLVPQEDWFAAPPLPPCGDATVVDPLAVRWEGPALAQHSLGLVNRRLALGLLARGHEVGLLDVPSPGPQVEPGAERDRVAGLLGRALPRAEDVVVRHAWPPSWRPPASGHWVVIQPWEYGAVPREWVAPLRDLVDELWVPSSYVRDGFVQSGVPADRVHVVPNGVDADLFTPEGERMTLPTKKAFKLLFVGGTIHRKGIDVLLSAYGRAFTSEDDVALVIKDMGNGSFYRGQTAERLIEEFRSDPARPEVVYLDGGFTDGQVAALYRACDCLVHPYRGEGFGLPIAEAMSCGLPVVVTGHGAALDFVDEEVGWLVPAREVLFPEERLGETELAGRPRLAEPEVGALVSLLREVRERGEERARRGRAGRQRVLSRLTWEHAVGIAEQRLLALRQRPVRRGGASATGRHSGAAEVLIHGHRLGLHDPSVDRVLSGHLASGAPYEPFETQLVLNHVREGDTVLDLGANVGYYTLLLARQVSPTGRVFAFEPDPDNFALLQRNVERNGYRNVTLVQKAVTDRNGVARLHLADDNSGDHRVYDSGDGRPSHEVEAVRVDDVLADPALRVSLVKMDIQGAEGLALEGMKALLARSPGVRLVCEFWPWGLRRAGTDPAAFLRTLRQLGFQLNEIIEARSQFVRTDEEALLRRAPLSEGAFTNLYCEHVEVLRFKKGGPKISLCVIAKDEEGNIEACLDSARDLVDEVVVVDTGSKDRTRELALAKGAKVFDFPWVDSFSAARNACLDSGTGAWIFWLDADDRLDEENREKLRALFASLPEDGNVAYSMKCRCLPDPVTNMVTVVDHVRLFRNHEKIRWRYRVHEQILGSVKESGGEVRFVDVTVLHTGYVDHALRQKKLQRDLRLLQLEYAEQPRDPFTLFNLGATFVELGRHQEAIPLLEESLGRSHPGDSIVRKLYSLLANCQLHLGRKGEAVHLCVQGQSVCPNDAELHLLEGIIRTETGDLHGAKSALLRLICGQAGPHFASVADGLRTYRGRHQLASVCRRLGEVREAEGLWRQALRDFPGFLPAWAGLAYLYLDQRRWDDLETATLEVERSPQGEVEAVLLRAKALFVRREFHPARHILEAALEKRPDAVPLWEQYSFVLLEEGRDGEAAERALLKVLELDHDNGTARQNLHVFRSRQAGPDAVFHGDVALGQLYQRACDSGSDTSGLLPIVVSLARKCRHVTEFGAGSGVFTTALLFAQPERLVSYDRARGPGLDRLASAAGRTRFVFRQEDVLWAAIEPTDLLLIDTRGTCDQLRQELSLHAESVSRYILVARTTLYGQHGEDEGSEGLWPAVEELLAEGHFVVDRKVETGVGLAVLRRAREWRGSPPEPTRP